MGWVKLARLLLALLAATFFVTLGEVAASAPSLEVGGTLFLVTLPDSRELTSPNLIGAILDATDETGRVVTMRIDAVTRDDPSKGNGDIWLHRFSTPDANTGGANSVPLPQTVPWQASPWRAPGQPTDDMCVYRVAS